MNTDVVEVSCECCDQPASKECPCDPCECDPCECDPCECKDCKDSSYTSDSNAEKSSIVDDDTDDGADDGADDEADDEADDDSDGFEEEFDDDHSCILRGKWLFDGSKTIDDMIAALQREIVLLTDLKNDGWVLETDVEDDYAYLVKPEVET